MTVALVMMARDEEAIIGRAIESARELVDEIHVLDTGSTDGTANVAESFGARVELAEWEGFGPGRTAALQLAREATWVLMLDADQTVAADPGLRAWLDTDPDPATDVWLVETVEAGTSWRMPRLTRGGIDWTYAGATHEWLDTDGHKTRQLLGLTIEHHADGTSRAVKHERDLELLAPGVLAGDPRSIYYTAQTLDCLGRHEEAAAMYDRRATMAGWEEEAWHAAYQAARLRRNVPGLVAAHLRRPWRHEPLTMAARIVKGDGARDDVLFLEG